MEVWIRGGVVALEVVAADSGNDATMGSEDADGLGSWLVDFEDFRS